MEIRHLGAGDLDLLLKVEPGLFDHDIDPIQAAAFLADPLHHIVLAFDGAQAVGMATGTVILHPDKPPCLFINEVGTRDSHLRQGIGAAVTQALIDLAREKGWKGIWLGTEPDNFAALGLYRKLGGQEQTFVGFGWDDAF